MGAITFTDRLPDPNWTIDTTGAGHASSYTAGPGFKAITFSSKGRLNPFYVVLPNQSSSRNTAFNAWLATPKVILADGALNAGVEVMKQKVHSDVVTTQPQPGDMFTITDDEDSLHTKIYRITRVTNEDNYLSGSVPADVERYVYFTPNLQRGIKDEAIINYTNPQIRVILKSDVQEFSLGTNNLYTFGLQLQEAQA